jgi:ketosteroid isomerase-like protein
MSAEENKAMVRHTVELLNQKKVDEFLEYWAPEYVEHYTDHDESREVAKQNLLNFLNAPFLSDYSLTLDHLLAEGDKVVYRATHRFTDKSTGKKIQMTNMGICRIAKGKQVELWVSVDSLHLWQQFEVLPPTEEIVKKFMERDSAT